MNTSLLRLKIHYHLHWVPQMKTISSQFNPRHNLPPHTSANHFNIILYSMAKPPIQLLPLSVFI